MTAKNPIMDTPLIEIQGLSFSYDGSPVFENVSLSIPRGDFVCLVGPNGGGKTTLLKLLLGLLAPTRGMVRIFGHPPAEARSRMGYLPQGIAADPSFPVSAADVVLMGRLGNASTRRALDREIASRALHDVGLYELRNRPFSSLSGGQRQRLLIARALATEPEILLLYEPTAHIDIRVEGELYVLLAALNARMTIVMVSHDLRFVPGTVKNVVCVKRGLVAHPTSEISGEILRELYGGEIRMVRHDLRCAGGGAECMNS